MPLIVFRSRRQEHTILRTWLLDLQSINIKSPEPPWSTPYLFISDDDGHSFQPLVGDPEVEGLQVLQVSRHAVHDLRVALRNLVLVQYTYQNRLRKPKVAKGLLPLQPSKNLKKTKEIKLKLKCSKKNLLHRNKRKSLYYI